MYFSKCEIFCDGRNGVATDINSNHFRWEAAVNLSNALEEVK